MSPGRREERGDDPAGVVQGCSPERAPVKARLPGVLLAGVALFLGSCDDDGTMPMNLRFGQLGEIRAQVVAPLLLGQGEIQQVLTWNSNGAWTLLETISYRGVTGSERILRSSGDPAAFASAYASLITQVNQSAGLRLFIETLDPDLDPECGLSESRVTFRIRDEARDEARGWTRCTTGTLTTLSPRGAGPEPDASRVVVATTLARDFTLGDGFQPAFTGSLPYSTLDRGETSPDGSLTGPRAFRAEEGSAIPPPEWATFWGIHSGGAPFPGVDWLRDMVVVAAVGERFEAGDSVEVRRVLTVNVGGAPRTVVEFGERVPGDFCSPASRNVRPFHIVVTPRTTSRVSFTELPTERVPCGV